MKRRSIFRPMVRCSSVGASSDPCDGEPAGAGTSVAMSASSHEDPDTRMARSLPSAIAAYTPAPTLAAPGALDVPSGDMDAELLEQGEDDEPRWRQPRRGRLVVPPPTPASCARAGGARPGRSRRRVRRRVLPPDALGRPARPDAHPDLHPDSGDAGAGAGGRGARRGRPCRPARRRPGRAVRELPNEPLAAGARSGRVTMTASGPLLAVMTSPRSGTPTAPAPAGPDQPAAP
jgi:hypothetical protein